MANSSDLDRFIREALRAGQSRQAISAALLQAGWTQQELTSALDDYAEVDFPIPVPRPRASLSAREAFLYLLLFTLLYFLCFHLGSLLFDLVNALLPDPSIRHYRSWDFYGATRFSTATLLITFPLFAWMAHFLGRETAKTPIQRFSPVRRWLTYLTLFVSAATLVADLTTLVYNLLGGELTLRFLLKILIVALIASAVFGYYLRELRQTEIQARPSRPLGAYLLGGGAALALLALIGGFGLMGSPMHQRDLHMDQRRINDLQALEEAIRSHAREGKGLPQSLEALKRPGHNLSLHDPQTQNAYGYERLDDARFRLCAEFTTDSSQRQSGRRYYPNHSWPHGIGQTCFDRRLNRDDLK